MNTINSIGAGDSIQQVVSNPITRSTAADSTTVTARPADSVEISSVGQFIQSLKDNNIRTDKVATVRAQIDAGTYEDDSKLNTAADKLLDDISK